MAVYDTLNKPQKEAVFHTEGPLLILAGAGSGKTRVLTHRTAYLIDELGVNPYNIMAITFTNKAAGEMRERIDKMVGYGSESIWVSTFHSTCVRILRRYIDRLGYSTNFTIYDTDDSKNIIKEVCKKLQIDTKVYKERSLMSAISSGSALFSGLVNGVIGTSYTSEDSDLVATENNYAAKENELQQQIDNIESTHPGYDEYRYDLDSIGHNPHELASYLTALLQTYTPQSAQAELNRVFAMQYTLTLTEETEIRYRTETSTDPETGETTTEEVPYEYHILNVKLTSKPISEIAEELLTPQQLEMYRVYLETSGNKPLIFGGGSPDMGASEDLSGVQLVNGTRPGNTAVVDLAKRQVGNVGGRPYWSWYGFNSRVEWCACFVSWCYNQAGKSEPRFAGCQSQGVPWFQSRGQWGARGYENIAPGDAIFFDWDGDGSADHVGLVIGTDGERVYTVEGNSGDACKIKSYPVNYSCIKGYGLMNWN